MVRVARFEKVSLRRFVADWVATFPQQTVEQAVAAYERIRLPERATSGSAGYDLFAPVGFELGAGEGLAFVVAQRQGRLEGVDIGGGVACVIAGAVASMGEHRLVAVVGALQTAQPLHFGVHGRVLQQQRVARTDRFGFCRRERR